MKAALVAALPALLLATPALAGDCNYKTTANADAVTLMADAGPKYSDAMKSDAMTMPATVVDVATGNSDFSTLVAAASAAGLVETLQSDGPFTVFAPTNAAFDALPAGTVESLLQPENRDALQQVLLYHVVPGRVLAGDLSDGLDAPTAQGATVNFDLDSGATVNGANIVKTDILAGNGVVHVIDAVLLPPETS